MKLWLLLGRRPRIFPEIGRRIDIMVNVGAFNAGEIAFLFVVDADGNVNQEGLGVVVGASGPATEDGEQQQDGGAGDHLDVNQDGRAPPVGGDERGNNVTGGCACAEGVVHGSGLALALALVLGGWRPRVRETA